MQLPNSALQFRRALCSECSTPCPLRDTPLTDPCQSCPRGYWPAYADCEPHPDTADTSALEPKPSAEPRTKPPQKLGLGDMVAAIATPIARALHLPCIDPETNDLRPESPCAKRKKWLNDLTK